MVHIQAFFLGPVHVSYMPPLYIFAGPEIKAVVRHEIDNIVVAPPPPSLLLPSQLNREPLTHSHIHTAAPAPPTFGVASMRRLSLSPLQRPQGLKGGKKKVSLVFFSAGI